MWAEAAPQRAGWVTFQQSAKAPLWRCLKYHMAGAAGPGQPGDRQAGVACDDNVAVRFEVTVGESLDRGRDDGALFLPFAAGRQKPGVR
ncbi:MAG: hypothetical protein QOD96_7333 [Pseudonocardiales bacterium]|nr:hypothetical protein [Pseudonocardiales bacterium]